MPLQPGRSLGHYRIVRPLGSGGMGEVYEAEDTRLGRRVALKVLPEETARDPQRRERFDREARAIAALKHPGIVTIHSVEQVDGVDFITMELLEGRRLRDEIARGGLPFGKVLGFALPLAEAMAAAHQQGITHRDLKPENILIERDGTLKVVDFGLARRDAIFEGGEASASRAPTRALTEEGRIVGTAAYMSPEQAEGTPVDPRSDVFALGIILYELCTGERPFKGGTTMSLLSSILKDTPAPVTDSNVHLPHDLARIVNRCLMKDPGRRFQSAAGLATELSELKRASESGELPAIGRAAGRGGGLRKAAIAAGILAVAIGAFIALRGRSAGTAPPVSPGDRPASGPGVPAADARRRIVVLPFENLGPPEDAYFADGVTEEITSRLAAAGGLGVISRNSAMQYAKTTKSTRQIAAELNVDYVLAGTVRWQRDGGGSRVRVTPQLVRVADDTQLWGDRYDRDMQDIFAVQSEIADQVVGKLGLAMGRSAGTAATARPTDNLEAYQLYLQARAITEAGSDKDGELRAVALLEKAVALDPDFAQGWAALSYAHSHLYNLHIDFSEARLAKARECADRALALQPELSDAHLALGYYYYWGRKDYAQATAAFERAAGGREEDLDALEAMSYLRRRQGRWDEALAGMERAYALDPRNVQLVSNLAGTYLSLRRIPDALRMADVAIALDPGSPFTYLEKIFMQVEAEKGTRGARETFTRIDPAFPLYHGIASFLNTMDGRFQESIADLAKIPTDVIDGQTFYRPVILMTGLAYRWMGEHARAMADCGAASRRLEKDVADHPRDPRMRAAFSIALACLGRAEPAIREARLAADLMPVSTDAIEGPAYLDNLAQVHTMLGNHDQAFDILEQLVVMPNGTSINFIETDPAWAPLRALPRYRDLVARAATYR